MISSSFAHSISPITYCIFLLPGGTFHHLAKTIIHPLVISTHVKTGLNSDTPLKESHFNNPQHSNIHHLKKKKKQTYLSISNYLTSSASQLALINQFFSIPDTETIHILYSSYSAFINNCCTQPGQGTCEEHTREHHSIHLLQPHTILILFISQFLLR